MTSVNFVLNDTPVVADVDDDELLLDTLRDRFGTTSVRYSCGIGVCGTCTTLLDGDAVSSCLQLTQMVEGRRIDTAERVLDEGGRRCDVRDAFVGSRAFQCSYCIPPLALTVVALTEANPDITLAEIREELGGNICRCGSYPQILAAVATLLKEKKQ